MCVCVCVCIQYALRTTTIAPSFPTPPRSHHTHIFYLPPTGPPHCTPGDSSLGGASLGLSGACLGLGDGGTKKKKKKVGKTNSASLEFSRRSLIAELERNGGRMKSRNIAKKYKVFLKDPVKKEQNKQKLAAWCKELTVVEDTKDQGKVLVLLSVKELKQKGIQR